MTCLFSQNLTCPLLPDDAGGTVACEQPRVREITVHVVQAPPNRLKDAHEQQRQAEQQVAGLQAGWMVCWDVKRGRTE